MPSLQVSLSKPEGDEIEVSVFGPGRGESILVHIGGGRWISIDSCISERSDHSPALDYLAALGVDVGTDVILVIASHAHDDHTAGISRIFAAASSARFVTSAAFTSPEFFATVEADADIEMQLNQSVRGEFRAVLAEVRARGGRGRRPIIRATEQRLLHGPVDAWPAGPEVRVLSLSPSETAIDRAQNAVAEGAAQVDHRRRLAAPDPNEYSVAIWVQIGETALLFGGDLLIGPSACGWKAVADSHHPDVKASLFKVPHHGSKGAHFEPTWADLVLEDVVSVLTPFRMGARSIPRTADLQRITERSAGTYITAKTQQPAPSREVKRTRSKLPNFAQNVRERDAMPGHVQARKSASGSWSVALDGPAYLVH